ncbi:MAG: inorganic diphosphatase [Verrucomicrobiota bacterium]
MYGAAKEREHVRPANLRACKFRQCSRARVGRHSLHFIRDHTCRNDRLIGVAVNSRTEETLRKLTDLNKTLVCEIEHFFVSYNDAKGKRFSPERACQLVRASLNGGGAGKKR